MFVVFNVETDRVQNLAVRKKKSIIIKTCLRKRETWEGVRGASGITRLNFTAHIDTVYRDTGTQKQAYTPSIFPTALLTTVGEGWGWGQWRQGGTCVTSSPQYWAHCFMWSSQILVCSVKLSRAKTSQRWVKTSCLLRCSFRILFFYLSVLRPKLLLTHCWILKASTTHWPFLSVFEWRDVKRS